MTSRIVIVALWVLGLVWAAWTGLTVRPEEFTNGLPVFFGVVFGQLPLTLFVLWAWARPEKLLFVHPGIARWIDARAGYGATAEFLRRWRPLLLLGASAAVCALILGGRLVRSGTATHEWWLVGVMGSCAVGPALAHVMLKRRGVPGV